MRMRRASIGLDIGTSSVRAVELRPSGKHLEVSRFGRTPLPSGAVERGEVRDVQAVADAIMTLWKRLKITGRRVHIGLGNRGVVVRVVDMPAVARDDLEGAMRYQAQDHIPIPLSEAVMDYQVLGEPEEGDEESSSMRVLIAAAGRATVDPLIDAVRRARLEPASLELHSYPLVRAIGDAARTEAIVDVGAAVTTVVVHERGQVQFTRILPSLGGDDFTKALTSRHANAEEAERVKRHMTVKAPAPTEAAELSSLYGAPASAPASIKSAVGLADDDDPDDGGLPPAPGDGPAGLGSGEPSDDADGEDEEAPAPASAPSAALEDVVESFVAEMRGSLDYTSETRAELDRIVLTGGGSLLGGLAATLEESLGITTEQGHPFSRVPVGKMRVTEDERAIAEPFLAVAIGLAMAGEGA